MNFDAPVDYYWAVKIPSLYKKLVCLYLWFLDMWLFSIENNL